METKSFKNTYFKKNAKTHNSYYVNRFISLNAAADIRGLKLFPNAKEITKSFGAFEALQHLNLDRDDHTINIVVVGDGHTPRTAALFAFLTKWNCISIDPIFTKTNYNIKRLHCLKSKIEDISTIHFKYETVIIHVHSHSLVSISLNKIVTNKRHVVSIPCCYNDDIYNPDLSYQDENIWSVKNKINIYLNR